MPLPALMQIANSVVTSDFIATSAFVRSCGTITGL
jgi:hypothetical protein